MYIVIKDMLYDYQRFKLKRRNFRIFAETSPKEMAHCLAILLCIFPSSLT